MNMNRHSALEDKISRSISPENFTGKKGKGGMCKLVDTHRALGWREGRPYLPLQDDISSVAYWHQALITAPFPRLPDKDDVEVI